MAFEAIILPAFPFSLSFSLPSQTLFIGWDFYNSFLIKIANDNSDHILLNRNPSVSSGLFLTLERMGISRSLNVFHPLPLGRYRALKRTHSARRERKGRNEGRIMRCQTGVFDGAQLAFQVLIIFCGQHCLPSWGLGGAGEGDRPN